MKTIHFNNCLDCPFRHVWFNFEDNCKNGWTCGKNMYTEIPDINRVPDWCPIPENKK